MILRRYQGNAMRNAMAMAMSQCRIFQRARKGASIMKRKTGQASSAVYLLERTNPKATPTRHGASWSEDVLGGLELENFSVPPAPPPAESREGETDPPARAPAALKIRRRSAVPDAAEDSR